MQYIVFLGKELWGLKIHKYFSRMACACSTSIWDAKAGELCCRTKTKTYPSTICTMLCCRLYSSSALHCPIPWFYGGKVRWPSWRCLWNNAPDPSCSGHPQHLPYDRITSVSHLWLFEVSSNLSKINLTGKII